MSFATKDGPWRATIIDNDVAADKWYVLVDLSDTTNYPHIENGVIILHGIELQVEKKTTGLYDISVGVVRENDTTDGTADWIWKWSLEADMNATDHTDRLVDEKNWTSYDPHWGGLRLDIASDTLSHLVCNASSGNKTDLQNDAANLTDATGLTNKSAGVGDIVVFVGEQSGTGTVSFSIAATYSTI